MFNPFSGWRITGTWADHMSYSLGGIDYPLPYGTPLRAPAAGTLRISGGVGERAAGLIGSAGRRSVLTLDRPVLGLVAIVFQHQSAFGTPRHYDEGEVLGWSGASTVVGGYVREYGGDVHLHTHGLHSDGHRVDWLGYIHLSPSASPAGGDKTLLEEEDMAEEASVQEAIRIGNVNFAQNSAILAELAAIRAAQADDATEASVQEAVRVANATWARTGEVLSKPSAVIDPAKLASALTSAGIKVTIDSAALVRALDASLKDDFAKIPGAVRNAIVK
jgi:hypothetical protein